MKGIRAVVTYKCNIMCSHCEHNCGPHKKGIMSTRDFKEKVYEQYNNGYRDYIVIQGGEIFLNAGKIFKYLKAIMDLKIEKTLVTNGYWGYDQPYIDIIQDFKRYGVDNIIFEYDYFHSMFIDEECIKQGIKKAMLCNIKPYLKSVFITDDINTIHDIHSFDILKSIKRDFSSLDCIMEVADNRRLMKNEALIHY